jgi:hypothetical protein
MINEIWRALRNPPFKCFLQMYQIYPHSSLGMSSMIYLVILIILEELYIQYKLNFGPRKNNNDANTFIRYTKRDEEEKKRK